MIYFLVLVGFGLIVRRIRTFSEYAVGARAVPLAMIFASISATYIGPGYTMGFASKGFANGWLFWFLTLGFTLQNLLVAFFIAPRLHAFTDCYTLGDIIGKKHGQLAHVVSGIISTLLCIGFTSIMAKVGGLVIQGTIGWPLVVGVFVITGVGVLYCFTGGLQSVIATEALQFALFAVTIPILIWVAISSSSIDVAAANAQGWSQLSSTVEQLGALQIFGLFISFLLGETLVPPYANRALAAGSKSVARSGFLIAAIYSVVWFGMVIGLGVMGRQIMPDVEPDNIFMALSTQYLPHGLLGLLVIAVIAIIMSSQESVLNAAAVSFTRDIRDVIRPGQSDASRLKLTRITTLVVGIIAAAAAIWAPSIVSGLLIIYSIWAPSVLPVLVLAVMLKSPPKAAAVPAMIAGAGVSLVWQFALSEPYGVPAILAGLLANLVAYAIASVLFKRPMPQSENTTPSTGN